MRKIKLGVAILIATVLFTGCATTFGNHDNSSLQQKASFATGIEPSKLEIYNVEPEFSEVRFFAKSNGVNYACYYTSVAGVVQSDAICRKMDSSQNSRSSTSVKKQNDTNCNALLKAAGKC